MILGLTGGISTGKSTVSAMLKERGAVIIDADQVAREVVEPGTEGLRRIYEHFGKQVLHEDGRLNRSVLGDIIFWNEDLRKKLNELLHPLIRDVIMERTRVVLEKNPSEIVIWDVPMLIEGNLTQFVEKVIVVYIPEPIQLKRLMKRNSLSEAEARKRIASQLSIEEKKKLADYVIDNSGSLEMTERQVDQLWNYLTLKSGSSRQS
ncbi:dephospho-CoA kinase [Paenactinomyces guangxiensis]|uniref:Dephospho-CoA kinase n=1 Tax=Paenactinomyces guangxiensis TaxID=1490290 RepID=A0A7W1WUY4_9BACL|nr:dephospho-CoA kinase [Paenactinomyces guangxiensis]MBA4496462.1 dephospho-CoA kinase [Paenactinomyces guangxiensis]MBH8593578.1 dephospho-CoA kinase [Paenactinomyces guangxiensis]